MVQSRHLFTAAGSGRSRFDTLPLSTSCLLCPVQGSVWNFRAAGRRGGNVCVWTSHQAGRLCRVSASRDSWRCRRFPCRKGGIGDAKPSRPSYSARHTRPCVPVAAGLTRPGHAPRTAAGARPWLSPVVPALPRQAGGIPGGSGGAMIRGPFGSLRRTKSSTLKVRNNTAASPSAVTRCSAS